MTGEPAEPRDELRSLLRRIEEIPTDEPAPPQVVLRASRYGTDEAQPVAPAMPAKRAAGPTPPTRRVRVARQLVGAVAAGAVLAAACWLPFGWPKLWDGDRRTDDETSARHASAPERPEEAPSASADTGALPPIQAKPAHEARPQAAQSPVVTPVTATRESRAPQERTAPVGGAAPAVDAPPAATSAHPTARGDGERRDDATRDRLLIQGLRTLVLGGVNSARLLLRRAADAGDARAALVLGDTFDEVRLVQFGVLGVQPDRAKAAYWYERASTLGAPEANDRLSDLNAR